jgi:uncharacterized membrane protein YidH (DUF202 family)
LTTGDREAAGAAEAPSKPTARDRLSALIDADRLMMQLVQTSLSLIGFGFSINAFFNDPNARGGMVAANLAARRLGLALLCLGMLFLAMGVWNQFTFRRGLARQFEHLPGAPDSQIYSAAPSFVLAASLLLIGLYGLISILLRSAG